MSKECRYLSKKDYIRLKTYHKLHGHLRLFAFSMIALILFSLAICCYFLYLAVDIGSQMGVDGFFRVFSIINHDVVPSRYYPGYKIMVYKYLSFSFLFICLAATFSFIFFVSYRVCTLFERLYLALNSTETLKLDILTPGDLDYLRKTGNRIHYSRFNKIILLFLLFFTILLSIFFAVSTFYKGTQYGMEGYLPILNLFIRSYDFCISYPGYKILLLKGIFNVFLLLPAEIILVCAFYLVYLPNQTAIRCWTKIVAAAEQNVFKPPRC